MRALIPAALVPVLLATASPPAAAGDRAGAEELLAELSSCRQISHGKYRADDGSPARIPVCDTKGAVFFKADMDIDCDGQVSRQCNKKKDPLFQAATAFQQSDGKPLDSARLPYVVVPGASKIWKHEDSGIKGGAVAAVIHDGHLTYAVVGDTGPTDIIGEASYATAKSLGIDPDPARGGTGSGVTYVLFKNSRADPIESRDAAVTRGRELTERFVRGN
ncbi:Fungal chitosanase [Streptomyces sp. YIM 130001]|uniref:glycoside hydrolase family 75 protein n=1 Tax=Streptomyces sp. YIM 130001 TaxID=2259644 RepID=UPI000EE5896E|nr:glycoside hydrolase family 75 protein [Streptomyces sp. YIM 130001]RII09270.1 Fungal chitosanase [Streptomyces sp. YIM 130001]